MTDEDRPHGATGTSLEELVRLKKQVDASITYGTSGLNARQVTEMGKMDAAQWAKIKQDYAAWIQRRQVNAVVLFAVAVVGIFVWFYLRTGSVSSAAWPQFLQPLD